MKLEATSVKITGTPSQSGWTQVHEFKPEDEEKFKARGYLDVVIAFKRKEGGADTVATGRELLSRLHEEYFGNLEASAFVALKNSVEKVIKEFSESWSEVEIATVAVLGEVVYSAAGGGGRVNICRKGNIAKILESNTGETVSASGYPKAGDFIILGTKSFFESISQGVLKASLEGVDLQASVESLAPMIHSNPNSGNLGVVIIKFSEVKPAQIPIEPVKVSLRKVLNFLTKIIPERKIFIRGRSLDEGIEKKNSKVTFTVGAILLTLLLVSIGFGIKQNKTKKFKASYQGELTQAKNQLKEASEIFSADPGKARELFFDSQNRVQALLSRKIEDKELLSLENQLKEKEGQIVGIYKEEPELYMDLSLLSSGFIGDEIISSGEKLFVLDKNGKKIVGITITTKKTNLLAGSEQVDGISDILAYEDNVYGVFSDGVYLLGDKKEKVLSRDWEKDVLAYAYAGNIYILDKTASTIWRYPGMAGKYGSRSNWIAPGINIDFSKSKQMVIDGSVWVLSESSKITKLALGSPQKFIPSGVVPEPTSLEALYSNEEQKYFYVLDTNQKRVVVLDKDGGYRAQYLSDKISEANGLVVSEKDKKIILLAKDKLYSIELKHL